MSKRPRKLEETYLPGNPMALKLLGCLFVELIIESADCQKKIEVPIMEHFFNSFLASTRTGSSELTANISEKSSSLLKKKNPATPNKSTWNRWRNTKTERSPFLAEAIDRTTDAYIWARNQKLICEDEAELLKDIFKILINPSEAMGNNFDEELYFSYSRHVLTSWAGFTFYENGEDLHYFHETTGMMIDSVTLEILQPTLNGPLSRVEDAALKLAKELNKLGMLPCLSGDELHDLALMMWEYHDVTKKDQKLEFMGKPIEWWINDQHTLDLVDQYLMSEIKSLVTTLGGIHGKKAARARMTDLWNFVEKIT